MSTCALDVITHYLARHPTAHARAALVDILMIMARCCGRDLALRIVATVIVQVRQQFEHRIAALSAPFITVHHAKAFCNPADLLVIYYSGFNHALLTSSPARRTEFLKCAFGLFPGAKRRQAAAGTAEIIVRIARSFGRHRDECPQAAATLWINPGCGPTRWVEIPCDGRLRRKMKPSALKT